MGIYLLRCLSLVLLIASLPAVVNAQVNDDVVVKRGVFDNDLYVAGRSVDVVAQVQGDVIAAGKRVSIDQSVRGDVMAAGETVIIHAQVDDDVRTAGRTVTIAGPVAGHVVAAGETVTITPSSSIGEWAWLAGQDVNVSGRIGSELKVAAQRVTISGEVAGNVLLMAEHISIPASARIRGDLEYRSDNEPEIAPGAIISGEVIAKPPFYEKREKEGAGLFFLFALAVAGIVYYFVFPRFSLAAVGTLRGSPLSALGVGIAFLFATPFVVLLLFVTMIGLLVALPLLAWYLVSLLGGLLTGLLFVGDTGLRLAGKGETAGKGLRTLSVVLALVALMLIQLIPVAGGLALLLLFIFGLGALQLQAWRSWSGNQRPAG